MVKTKIIDSMLNIIKKNLGSQAHVDRVRTLWGDYKWHYGANYEE
jgi:hypothetical protein